MATPATALRGSSGRTVEQAVSYSIGHRVRIEILAALHEGPASSSELARIVHQPLSNLSHHIAALLASGSIEIADTRQVGNVLQSIYCMVELPEYTSEEFAAMSDDEKKATLAVVLQASVAEAMASLWAGKLVDDPLVMLAWNRVNLDGQGRDDLAIEQDRSWLRIKEIEAESANRRTKSGDPGITYVVTSFGYERSRTQAPAPVGAEKA